MTKCTHLKVGGKRYKIIYQEYGLTCNNEYGDFDGNQQVIRIDSRNARDEQADTLLHETLHACCHFAGIDVEEKLTEEDFVTRISPILHTVLKENHSLFFPKI